MNKTKQVLVTATRMYQTMSDFKGKKVLKVNHRTAQETNKIQESKSKRNCMDSEPQEAIEQPTA
jgi:hypothetical protein